MKTTTDLCIADDDWLQEQYELSMYHYTTKPDNRREQPQHKGKSKKKKRTKISVSNKLSDNAYFDRIKDSSHALLSFRESQATVAIANEEHKAWNLKQMAR